jgi:L-threonylcarbamoyladenylate synthase
MDFEKIKIASEFIQQGKVVAFPTETVYGLGANALNPIAVAKIFELKERPAFDPLIVHIAEKDDIYKYSTISDSRVTKIIEKFWPGPLTLVLPKKDIIPDIVTSGLPTVGLRMPQNEIALALIKQSGCPIAAPSANKFGRISPTTADHVRKYLPNVDYILDGGKTTVGIESTIITLTEKGFVILRNGFITKEDLEQVVEYDGSYKIRKNLAPGMMKSHYSPTKPIYILSTEIETIIDKSRAGLISYSGKYDKDYHKVIKLTEKENLQECAVNLFYAMHSLEESDVCCIVAEPVPERGIGIAIMDRLRKAAFTYEQELRTKKL